MQVKPRRNRRPQSQEMAFLKHLSPQHTWDHVSHKGCSEQIEPWQTAYREQMSNVNVVPSPRNTRHSRQVNTTTEEQPRATNSLHQGSGSQSQHNKSLDHAHLVSPERCKQYGLSQCRLNGERTLEQKPAGGLNLQNGYSP